MSKLVRFGAEESSMGFGFGFGLEFQSARVRLVCGWLGWLARVCIVDVGLADVAFVWRGG